MKQNTLKLWLLTAMVFAITPQQIIQAGCPITQACTNCNTGCSQSKNFWAARPFSSDASLEIALEKTVYQTESNREEWNGCFSFGTKYMQSFNMNKSNCGTCCTNLGSMPFWAANGSNTMTIGTNNGMADVDGYNFGLGNVKVDSDGSPMASMTLSPKITQAGTTFMWYFVHKKDERGMYFKVNAPLAAMIVNQNLCESNTEQDGSNNGFWSQTTTGGTDGEDTDTAAAITYSTNYPNILDRYQSMSSAFAGGFGTVKNALGGYPTDQISLRYGKISPCKLTVIRFADISAVLGVNVAASEKGFFGIGFKATCPTGNVPTAEYMLEPIVGRGGVWGVGADVMAHYKAWKNDEETKYLDIWLQGDLLHLIPGRTPSMRSFDLLANGKGSKYILVQGFKVTPSALSSDLDAGAGTEAAVTVPLSLEQAINVTTLPVNSKFAIEGSFALMLDYHCHDWNFALSGEFWGRTKECLSINTCEAIQQKKINLNKYAVVGRQASAIQVITNAGNAGNIGIVEDVIPLCQPLATINSAAPAVQLIGGVTYLPIFPPANFDGGCSSTPVAGTCWGSTSNPVSALQDATNPANRIPADLTTALDICGAAAARAFTGKVFIQLGYTWNDCRYTPNFSFIGGAEFVGKTNNAVSFWTAGAQGSINF